MPGRTPHEAFSAFVNPLASALACIAKAKVEISPGGRDVMGVKHNLYITGRQNEGYLRLGRSGLELRARMYYAIIDEPREEYGPIRITTRGYDYSIRATDGRAVLDFHWHPLGRSHETRPHLHIGSMQLRDDAVLANKQHVLTGRVTFESVIRQLIDMGVEPQLGDWSRRLDEGEGPHVLYRSWAMDYERETGRPFVDAGP